MLERPTMLAEVRQLLDMNRGKWPRIANDLGISYSWLQKVAQGQIKSPGVVEVERLHRYLRAA